MLVPEVCLHCSRRLILCIWPIFALFQHFVRVVQMCANVVFEKLDVTAHIFRAHVTEIIGAFVNLSKTNFQRPEASSVSVALDI